MERVRFMYRKFAFQKTNDMLEESINRGSKQYVVNVEKKRDHRMGIAEYKYETI